MIWNEILCLRDSLTYGANAPVNHHRQRFRKPIPFRYVQKHGSLVMNIIDGDLVEAHEETLKDLNTRLLK